MLQSVSAGRGQSETALAAWCKLPDNELPGETLAAGWERSYRSGCLDQGQRLAAGSEILHLVSHEGKLFAAVGYWMDPRNPWYGGRYETASWAQILRLDGPKAHWQVDLEMPLHLRAEILYSATFTTDANGAKLETPVALLLTSSYEGGGNGGTSLFTRDDTTGAWQKSKITAGPAGERGEQDSVMLVHRDKVTGIDRLFVSVGVDGVFSGVYDPTSPGKIRWDPGSETGSVPLRPLAIIEANGDLIYSADRAVLRRIDGPAPRYERIHDLSDLRASATYSRVGGIRGMTPIANPAGTGQSIIFVWAPDNRSRGCIMRLDPTATGGYERRQEICLDKLVSQYLDLDGSPVPYVLAGYNRFLAVTDPNTGATHHLIGAEAWIPGKRFATAQRNDNGGYYAGAMYAIRDDDAHYHLSEVNGSIGASAPPLVSTRAYALSPFAEDHGQVIYFGGYDCNFKPSSDTAWIFRTSLANALRELPARP